MADAKKCDRCGKYYDQEINTNKISRIRTVNYNGTVLDGMDLCPECCESFGYWFSEPKIPVA